MQQHHGATNAVQVSSRGYCVPVEFVQSLVILQWSDRKTFHTLIKIRERNDVIDDHEIEIFQFIQSNATKSKI